MFFGFVGIYRVAPDANHFEATGYVVLGALVVTIGLFIYLIHFVFLTFEQLAVIGNYLVATHIEREGIPQKPIEGAPHNPDDRQKKIEEMFARFGTKR